jgi:hypothetical protein
MAGHHSLLPSPTPSSVHQLSASLTGQIQTQAMSHAKFIFLIALVIFFVVLFVAAYVWMRRPEFGQKGGHPVPTGPAASVRGVAPRRVNEPRPESEVAPTNAQRLPQES